MEYCLKFIVDQKLKIEVLDFIEDYSQVSWFKKNDDWVFDLILTNKQKLINLKEQLLMKFSPALTYQLHLEFSFLIHYLKMM